MKLWFLPKTKKSKVYSKLEENEKHSILLFYHFPFSFFCLYDLFFFFNQVFSLTFLFLLIFKDDLRQQREEEMDDYCSQVCLLSLSSWYPYNILLRNLGYVITILSCMCPTRFSFSFFFYYGVPNNLILVIF